jgi:mannosyltransferase
MSVTLKPAVPEAASLVRPPHPCPAWVWAVPAAAGLAASLAAIGHQVLWQDELATFSASTRSLHALAALARERDAVLTPYYGFMHFWIDLFGSSPTALRLPSAVAMAVAAAATALIGARLFGPRAGLLAGLLLALVPEISRYGQDARPYVITVMLCAVATLLLLRAVESPGWARWTFYALSLAALGAAQLTGLFIVGAHGVGVASAWRRTRDSRLAGWLAACMAAAMLLIPILYMALKQTAQVAGVAPTSWHGISSLPAQLFGSGLVALAVIALAALAVRRYRTASLFCLALAIVPVILVLLVSIEQPLLRPRYLLYTLIGWALLAGATLSRLRKAQAGLALAVVLALALPSQLAVRSETLNHNQPDYRAISQIIETHLRRGDAIVMPTVRGIRFRVGLRVYLPARDHPTDVLRTRTAVASASLDASECAPATCIGSPARIWVGCDRERLCAHNPLSGLKPETARAIEAKGYVREHSWRVDGGAISLFRATRLPAEARKLQILTPLRDRGEPRIKELAEALQGYPGACRAAGRGTGARRDRDQGQPGVKITGAGLAGASK